MAFRIDPRKVGVLLAIVVICLTGAHLLGQYSKFYLDHDSLFGFVGLFNLDHERNVPTWFASTALFLSSMLLAIITCFKRTTRDPFTLHWAGLAAIFLCLAMDEAIGFHERLSGFVSSLVNTRGVFLFAWTIPAAIAMPIFVLLAGFIFTAGALGMEMVEGQYVSLLGEQNMAHAIMVAFEEFLEMSGVVLFIYALLCYLKTEYGVVQVQLGEESPKV